MLEVGGKGYGDGIDSMLRTNDKLSDEVLLPQPFCHNSRSLRLLHNTFLSLVHCHLGFMVGGCHVLFSHPPTYSISKKGPRDNKQLQLIIHHNLHPQLII